MIIRCALIESFVGPRSWSVGKGLGLCPNSQTIMFDAPVPLPHS